MFLEIYLPEDFSSNYNHSLLTLKLEGQVGTMMFGAKIVPEVDHQEQVW